MKKENKKNYSNWVKAALITALLVLVFNLFLGGDFEYLCRVILLNYSFFEGFFLILFLILSFIIFIAILLGEIITFDSERNIKLRKLRKEFKQKRKDMKDNYNEDLEKLLLEGQIKYRKKRLRELNK